MANYNNRGTIIIKNPQTNGGTLSIQPPNHDPNDPYYPPTKTQASATFLYTSAPVGTLVTFDWAPLPQGGYHSVHLP